jgi:hypothetical protein
VVTEALRLPAFPPFEVTSAPLFLQAGSISSPMLLNAMILIRTFFMLNILLY